MPGGGLPPYGDVTKPAVAWAIVIVACIVAFLDLFQSSMVIFGLTEMKDELDFTTGDLNWVLVAYTLTFATTLLVGGQLADRVGLRITFLIGTLMLVWPNILVAWAPNKNALLAGRALAGIGAAMTVSGCCLFLLCSAACINYTNTRWVVYSALPESPSSATPSRQAKIETMAWLHMSRPARSAPCWASSSEPCSQPRLLGGAPCSGSTLFWRPLLVLWVSF